MNLIDIKNKISSHFKGDRSSSESESAKQNFGLTLGQFEDVIAKLKLGDESLFEKIFLAHFDECMIFLINNHKTSIEDAYDVSMDTLIKFRQDLLCGKIAYGNLRYLFTRMAANAYIKSVVKEKKLKEIFASEVEEEDASEAQFDSLLQAWDEMSAEDKSILENYYYLDIPLTKIAELEKKPDATLRKQKQRAIEKLRTVFFTKYIHKNEK